MSENKDTSLVSADDMVPFSAISPIYAKFDKPDAFPIFSPGDYIRLKNIRPLLYEYYRKRTARKIPPALAYNEALHDQKLAMKHRWEAGAQKENFNPEAIYNLNLDKNIDTPSTSSYHGIRILKDSKLGRAHTIPEISKVYITNNTKPNAVLAGLLHNYSQAPLYDAGSNRKVTYSNPSFPMLSSKIDRKLLTLDGDYVEDANELAMPDDLGVLSPVEDYKTKGNHLNEAAVQMAQAKAYMRANGYPVNKDNMELTFDQFLNMPQDKIQQLDDYTGKGFHVLNKKYKEALKYYEDRGKQNSLKDRIHYIKLKQRYDNWKKNASQIWLQSNRYTPKDNSVQYT